MNYERWQLVKELFEAALERGPGERAAFLAQACPDDESIRREVEALLVAHAEDSSFMNTPVINLLIDEETALATGQRFGEYEAISLLGEGGMGQVYLAADTRLGRKVALKLLPSSCMGDTERVRRFGQEARAASALNHPNIITIYEIGQVGDKHFIATEFIDGATLRENFFCDGNNSPGTPLRLREVMDIAIQVADALVAAHEAGIVHRDIKPENIMVRRRDGYVKLLDFGLAKLAEEPFDSEAPTRVNVKTSPGVVIGTVNYMSPEQARGEQVDERTDIWSLGVVLYEMVAGCAPFVRPTNNEILASILSDKEPPPLARYSREAPAELERIIYKALSKDRDTRYQAAKELLIDLRRLKQRLVVEAEIERTSDPQEKCSEATASTADVVREPAIGQTTSGSSDKQTLAGQNGFFQNLLRHKFYALTGIMLLAGVGFGAWHFSNPSTVATQIESIAVMPFVNESGNADAEYLSDGMTETLIGSLSQLPNLSVKARSSVFRYKGKEIDSAAIGKELGVQAILNGRVVQRGEELILYLELIDTQNGNRLWGDQYQRKKADLLSLQGEIAQQVSQNLRLKLSGAEQHNLAKTYTQNSEAFQLYLRGNFHVGKRTEREIRTGIDYFEQAIAKDPNYALAYTGLASAYVALPNYSKVPWPEVLPKIKDATLKALSLDNNLAEAHSLLGLIMNIGGDIAGSEREYQRAIALNPNSSLGYHLYSELLKAEGRLDEALTQERRALELEPVSLVVNREYASKLFFARRYDEAIAQFRKTMELDASFPSPHYGLACVYWVKGNYPESVEEHAKHQELLGEPQKAALMRESFARGGWQAFLLTVTDESHHFNWTLDHLTAYYAALGRDDEAFNLINKRFGTRRLRPGLLKDPRFDPLRDDPRFDELVGGSGK